MTRWSITGVLLILSALCVTGCQDDGIATMSGTLLIDGEPAPEGTTLLFDPVGKGFRTSWGECDKNGYYEAQYSLQREGVCVGECTARLQMREDELPEEGVELNMKYPSKYYTEIKTFTVEPGRNKVDFEISSKE